MGSGHSFKLSSGSSNNLYRLFDIIVIATGLVFSAFLYNVNLSKEYLLALTTALASYSYAAELIDLYRPWRAGKLRHMLLYTGFALVISFFCLVLCAFLFKYSDLISRVTIGLWFAVSVVLLGGWRLSLYGLKVYRRKLGINVKKVAIIGATESGVTMFNEIKEHNELGYDLVGFFDDRSPSKQFKAMSSDRVERRKKSKLHDVIENKKMLHLQGCIDSAVQRARQGEIQVLFIALPMKAQSRIQDILAKLGDTTVDVHVIPDFLLSNLIHARIDHVGSIDTISVFESPYYGAREFIKRTEDILVSSLILMLISPLMLMIALGIKLTSRGPVLFKQDRYGLAGVKIKVWKFRSMKVMENSEVVTQATKNDARVTAFGSFLRKTSLDELPQFLNVLLGDMSIVGPRPHAVAHNEEYRKKVEFYMLRHKVKPGITGWAQINGWRGETDTDEKMEKRIACDLHYIKHWSLMFDLKIIFLTIFKGFSGKNAY